MWTWTAICADTKLMPSWLIGRRNAQCATEFVSDLASRLRYRVHITSDGHNSYLVGWRRRSHCLPCSTISPAFTPRCASLRPWRRACRPHLDARGDCILAGGERGGGPDRSADHTKSGRRQFEKTPVPSAFVRRDRGACPEIVSRPCQSRGCCRGPAVSPSGASSAVCGNSH